MYIFTCRHQYLQIVGSRRRAERAFYKFKLAMAYCCVFLMKINEYGEISLPLCTYACVYICAVVTVKIITFTKIRFLFLLLFSVRCAFYFVQRLYRFILNVGNVFVYFICGVQNMGGIIKIRQVLSAGCII